MGVQEEMGQDARIPGTSVREAGLWGPGASWVQIRAGLTFSMTDAEINPCHSHLILNKNLEFSDPEGMREGKFQGITFIRQHRDKPVWCHFGPYCR